MSGSKDRRGARPKSGLRGRLESGIYGHGSPQQEGSETGGYWRGGFRQRRKALGISVLSVALVALALAGALFGARALTGEEVGVSGGSTSQESQQRELASSQEPPEKAEAGTTETTRAESGAVENSTTKQRERGQPTAGMQKLGEYETDYRYSDSESRKYNLRLSSEAVNGTVLEPGEVFSMNDHIAGLDYKEAKVFADGGESSALGGGLCQVTSTVYMAAQYAGLEIVERNPHYTVLPYIRPGFDATVWFGGQGIPELDMRFKNTTGSDILIREYITEDGILKAEVWGQPNGKEVTMRSERDFKDTEKGIKWSTYKTVSKDGEVIREGLVYEDIYSYPPPESVGDEGYNDVRVGGWEG